MRHKCIEREKKETIQNDEESKMKWKMKKNGRRFRGME